MIMGVTEVFKSFEVESIQKTRLVIDSEARCKAGAVDFHYISVTIFSILSVLCHEYILHLHISAGQRL